jgi:uridine kinase
LFIAIVGGSGAGKSWLAQKLNAALAPHAIRVSLDDFYRDRSRVPPALRSRINFDKPSAIDWDMLERALDQWAAGRAARLPQYDFKTHCRERDMRLVPPGRCILVEGLWLLRRASLRRRFTLKIFIDCPSALRLRRRCERDQLSRGRSLVDIRRQFRSTVDPMHCRFVEPQRRWADLILPPDFSAAHVRMVAEVVSSQ